MLYGGALALCALAMPLLVRVVLKLDLASVNWQNLQAGGATAGTQYLLDPQLHAAWQIVHHVAPGIFAYPPGVAWLYVPFAHLSISAGLAINTLIVIACCIASAALAARTYSVAPWFAVLCIFAWEPALDSIQTGENGAIAMLLAFWFAAALSRGKALSAGCAAGLMCFKPSIALVFLVVLLARREWRALLTAAAIGIMWYVAGVAATAFDWSWPMHYAAAVSGYVQADLQRFAVAAMSLPALLMRFGIAPSIASLCGLLLIAAAIPRLRRTTPLGAASVAGLLALAASPHAWGYDASIVLPALFFVMKTTPEPARTRTIACAYVLAAVQVFSTVWLGFNTLAIVIVGGALWWVVAVRTSDDGVVAHDFFAAEQ